MTTTSTDGLPVEFYRCDECDLLVAEPTTTVVVRKLLVLMNGESTYYGEPKALCNFCRRTAHARSS